MMNVVSPSGRLGQKKGSHNIVAEENTGLGPKSKPDAGYDPQD
jgi:hypothetical protein